MMAMASTRMRALLISALVAMLAGCTSTKSGAPAEPSALSPSEKTAPENLPGRSDVAEIRLITAQTPAVRAYRKIGSGAIYKAYPTRIHKGKIPPLVYAVVVVETDIDAMGKVVNVGFSRTPSHAPEVPPMIAELIRKASPLPSPGRLGAHTYVDTWLWDKSGTFQLDSRTLGQRDR
jgi:periplasmic protein TonB